MEDPDFVTLKRLCLYQENSVLLPSILKLRNITNPQITIQDYLLEGVGVQLPFSLNNFMCLAITRPASNPCSAMKLKMKVVTDIAKFLITSNDRKLSACIGYIASNLPKTFFPSLGQTIL